MGFDVVYLTPIHPMRRTFRKGKNNLTASAPDNVGSPWALGAAEGGHKAIHPALGTLEDFRHLVATTREHGMETALDIALQCAPDHSYIKEHTRWFRWRPDGTVQYAENPPKKYQDIYPFAFAAEDWKALWEELPGVFLSEAFTRPKVMYNLAKPGFTQTYTYFASCLPPSHASRSPCSNDCVCASSVRRRGTAAMSVWEKSWPLNSSGWPVALHNAYAKQSPKLSPARWRPLP